MLHFFNVSALLSKLGTEILIFLGSELIVRFIIPSPTRRADQLKLLGIQASILVVATLLLIFYHIPFLLLLFTVFVCVRFISIYYSSAVTEVMGAPHVHVSKPLRKSVTSENVGSMQSLYTGRDSISRPNLNYYQPFAHANAVMSRTGVAESTATKSQMVQQLHHRPLYHHNVAHQHKIETSSSVESRYPTVDNYTKRLSVRPHGGVVTSNTLSRTPLRSQQDAAYIPASHEYDRPYSGQSYLQYVSSFWNHKRPSECPPGISNSGNVCFINSTLQALAWTPGFIEKLKSTTEIQATSENSSKIELLKCLHSLLDKCRVLPDGVSHFGTVNQSEFLKGVSELAPGLVAPPQGGNRQFQQDASEFLLWLLDITECDAVRCESQNSSEACESASRRREECHLQLYNASADDISTFRKPLSELAEVDWILQSNKESFLTRDLFLGQMVEARECQNCKKMSVNVEYFTVLPLPIPQCKEGSVRQSLTDCFNCFSNVEELNSSNMMVCSCSPNGDNEQLILTPGRRLAMLSRLPKRMIIQLTRFSYNTSRKLAQKNSTPISIMMNIDVTPFLMESKLRNGSAIPNKKTMVYSLYALCIHTGAQSTSFGHYLAYCRAANNVWYCFDDSHVCAVADMEYELQTAQVLQNAYLLFYTTSE